MPSAPERLGGRRGAHRFCVPELSGVESCQIGRRVSFCLVLAVRCLADGRLGVPSARALRPCRSSRLSSSAVRPSPGQVFLKLMVAFPEGNSGKTTLATRFVVRPAGPHRGSSNPARRRASSRRTWATSPRTTRRKLYISAERSLISNAGTRGVRYRCR